MKRAICMAALAAATTASNGKLPPAAAQPLHGALDVRHLPQPELVSPHPVIIRYMSAETLARALYLYVPQRHRAKWDDYCHFYKACGHPVYFVTESWIERVYRPLREEELRRESINRKRNPARRIGIEF